MLTIQNRSTLFHPDNTSLSFLKHLVPFPVIANRLIDARF